MIIWVLNALIVGLLLGYLMAEQLAGGFQVVFQVASGQTNGSRVAQVGVQVRAGVPA